MFDIASSCCFTMLQQAGAHAAKTLHIFTACWLYMVVLSIASCLALKTGTTLTTLPLKLFMHRYTRFQFCFLNVLIGQKRLELLWSGFTHNYNIVAWLGSSGFVHPQLWASFGIWTLEVWSSMCAVCHTEQHESSSETVWISEGQLAWHGEFFSVLEHLFWHSKWHVIEKTCPKLSCQMEHHRSHRTIESCCVALFQQCCRRFAHSCRSLRRQKAISNLWVK